MLFLLATPEYNNVQSNTTKVKVHLRSGVAEILEQHQDLMGKVENNIIEIETNSDNKIEKTLYVLQDAVFVVSNQGLDSTVENQGTGVYVYAKRVKEINSSVSIDAVSKEFEQKTTELDLERSKMTDAVDQVLTSKMILLEDEIEFLKKVVLIVKELRS
jgi:F0F1-type ATP synthase epsilon subunit